MNECPAWLDQGLGGRPFCEKSKGHDGDHRRGHIIWSNDAARLAAVEAVLTRMECRSVDHRHPNEAGHWGVEGRAYYYAGDVIDDIYELRAAVAADSAVEVGLRGPDDREARWRVVARAAVAPIGADDDG